MGNDLLPIGSVIKLKKIDQPIVIVGYLVGNGKKVYDYVGFPYPEGIFSMKTQLLFDKDLINEVVHEGYKFKNFKQVEERIEITKKEIENK
jgi:hypothetical protein